MHNKKEYNSIIIYQMGKVGSTSIVHALREKKLNPLHLHWIGSKEPIAEFPTNSLDVYNNINNNYAIMVIVRDPMARNLSAFFQRIRRWASKKPEEMTAKELQKDFIEKYDVTYPDKWFDKELKEYFKLDINKKKFNKDKGYSIYEVETNRILLITLEKARNKLGKAIKDFIGLENVEMQRIGAYEDRKVGANLKGKYSDMKKLIYPKEFIEKNYNLKYVKKFYTTKEINLFKSKWRSYDA